MSHWKNANINLGVIKAGSAKKVVFEALPDIPAITGIIPYCGCTTSEYDPKKGKLVINYSNKKIPDQVKGAQSITKKIDIVYITGVTETLTIKATKIR